MIRRVNSVIAIIICATFLFYITPIFFKAKEDVYEAQEQESGIRPLSIREIITRFSDDSCEIKLEVTFEGEVNPPLLFYHTKESCEKKYEGNLRIECIEQKKEVTDAIYSGELY